MLFPIAADLFIHTQMARIMELNPETAGLASAHEVVAWAMRDVGDYFSSVDPEAGRKININFNWNNTGGQVLALRAAISRLYAVSYTTLTLPTNLPVALPAVLSNLNHDY